MTTEDTGPATDDFSDASSCSCLYDSIAGRRRQGEYFHRPPVWFLRSDELDLSTPSPSSNDDYTPGWEIEDFGHGAVIGLENNNPTGGRESYASDPESTDPKRVTCSKVDTEGSKATLTPESRITAAVYPRFHGFLAEQDATDIAEMRRSPLDFPTDSWSGPMLFYQTKARLCTRLRFCRDVRLEEHEQWAIQEGSLVVGIDPSYTYIPPQRRRPDEFKLGSGDLYVVCRLYADLWALCVRVSLQSLTSPDLPAISTTMNLAVLPLCAVTLAANFGSFSDRCNRQVVDLQDEVLYSGNGLCVVPPVRSHSLNVCSEIIQRDQCPIRLPTMAHEVWDNFTSLNSPGVDYVPLDSTLDQLFSKVGTKSARIHNIRKSMSLRRLWNSTKSSDSSSRSTSPQGLSFAGDRHFQLSTALSADTPKASLTMPVRGGLPYQRRQRGSSSVSQGLKRLFGVSQDLSEY